MIAGFIYGFDSLDDFDDFKQEEGLKALFGEDSPKGRTLGDFLRDFESEHLERMNHFLSKMSYSMMTSLQNNLPEVFKPKNQLLRYHSFGVSGLYYLNTTCADQTMSSPPVSPLIFEVTKLNFGHDEVSWFSKTKIQHIKTFLFSKF